MGHRVHHAPRRPIGGRCCVMVLVQVQPLAPVRAFASKQCSGSLFNAKNVLFWVGLSAVKFTAANWWGEMRVRAQSVQISRTLCPSFLLFAAFPEAHHHSHTTHTLVAGLIKFLLLSLLLSTQLGLLYTTNCRVTIILC